MTVKPAPSLQFHTIAAVQLPDRGLFTPQIRDAQVTVTEQKSLQGGLLTEDKMETLECQDETTQFDDWATYFDDDYELDDDCNQPQPCRCDLGGGSYDDDFDAGPPPSQIEVYLQRWWYPAKRTVRSYLIYHFPWLRPVNKVVERDFEIPF